MRTILDFIVSDVLENLTTLWIAFIILGVLLIFGTAVKKKKLKSIFFGFFIVLLLLVTFSYVFFLNLLNPVYLGYGRAKTFDASHQEGEWLVAVDHLSMGDGDGGSTNFYRLHIINQQSGKTTERKMIGKDFVALEKISEQKVWIRFKDKTVIYKILTGEEVVN